MRAFLTPPSPSNNARAELRAGGGVCGGCCEQLPVQAHCCPVPRAPCPVTPPPPHPTPPHPPHTHPHPTP
jgi:hypothetical protein